MNEFFNNTEINWQARNLIKGLAAEKIETVDEYVAWVKQWKETHRKLVAAIHHFRLLKNKAKLDKDELSCRYAWYNKLSLRVWARDMYQMRIDNKAELKAGAFKEVEKV